MRSACKITPPLHAMGVQWVGVDSKGRVTYIDAWLRHKSGLFQLDTLTEGQSSYIAGQSKICIANLCCPQLIVG